MSTDYKTTTKPGTSGSAPPIPTTQPANVPLTGGRGPDFPAPGAAEAENQRRGQSLIDAVEAARRGKK